MADKPEKVDKRVRRKENHYLYGIMCEALENTVRAAVRDALIAADDLNLLTEAPENIAHSIAAYSRRKLADAWRDAPEEVPVLRAKVPVVAVKEEVRSDGN